MQQLGCHSTDFHEILYWKFFSKICPQNSIFITIRQEQRILYMKTDRQFWSHLAQLFSEWEIFQRKVVEKIKTHILCSVTFFRKSLRLWDNLEKHCRAGQNTDGNKAHAHCMLDNEGYKHTHSEYVILPAFPLHQWLRERAPSFRYPYIECLVINSPRFATL